MSISINYINISLNNELTNKQNDNSDYLHYQPQVDSGAPEGHQQQTKPTTSSKSDTVGEEDVNIIDDVEEEEEPESDPEFSNRSFEDMVCKITIS